MYDVVVVGAGNAALCAAAAAREGLADDRLVTTLVTRAYPTVQWMRERLGIRWVLMYGRQAYRVEGKLKFWGGMITEPIGGGKGLSDALFAAAERFRIEVRYETK